MQAQVTSSPGPSKGTFSVRLEGPANLWGKQTWSAMFDMSYALSTDNPY